jgi:hypothetical protein
MGRPTKLKLSFSEESLLEQSQYLNNVLEERRSKIFSQQTKIAGLIKNLEDAMNLQNVISNNDKAIQTYLNVKTDLIKIQKDVIVAKLKVEPPKESDKNAIPSQEDMLELSKRFNDAKKQMKDGLK